MIEPEVAELLESPCSLIVGTVDADGLPDATRGGASRSSGPDRVRVLLAADATARSPTSRDGGRIALDRHPLPHRCVRCR